METSESVICLKGIGPKTAEKFEKAGIRTVGDLLALYPRTYDAFEPPTCISEKTDGQDAAVCGFIEKSLSVRYLGRFQVITGKIRTQTELIPVTWFNMPYLRTQVQPGKRYVFRGRVKAKGKNLILQQPKLYDPAEYELAGTRLQPVYPLRTGLTENMIRKAISQALDETELERDYLPEDIRLRYDLAAYSYAIRRIHFPKDRSDCLTARRRLVFDEFLLFILALRNLRRNRQAVLPGRVLAEGKFCLQVIHSLPYTLTEAQQKVWQEVKRDLTGRTVMTRLIQGDVGSGKTIIAFLALILTAENQAQGAMMVPTEVLARQHFEAFQKLVSAAKLPIDAVLLTGSMKEREKKEIYGKIRSGEALVVIGTHALIQEAVEYRRLSLVITDEQHRFGVRQREALSGKGQQPHMLVMSATPIPRTLAVIMYGDLDISVIDQMPSGRLAIKNCVVDPSWRPKAYAFIEKEVRLGHQAYVICAMVEESDLMEAENVMDYTQTLQSALPGDISVAFLHGRMKSGEKNEIMERFVRGEIQVLVSTTVIEVGVNVPNATVMMIEDAQRFGLAQLHQLRGRVGRGRDQSYCIMINSSDSAGAAERLKIMNSSNDGFEIAGKDLQLRGPGDLFGIRQSGLMDFRIADVFADAKTMQEANEAVREILADDEKLEREAYSPLRRKLEAYINGSDSSCSL